MAATQAETDIHLEGVSKRFGEMTAVDDLTLSIPRGNFFAMLGPSGCGKTTTLRMIGGFEDPTAGQGVPRRQRRHPAPALQARRQHRLPVLRAVPAPDRREERRVRPRAQEGRQGRGHASAPREALELVQLGHLAKRKPGQLSGGQQQRVALARALVNRPRALLLDEPLGALDLRLRKQLQIELKRIQQDVGITFVHVTHDQEEAMSMADTIAVMNGGKIEQAGSATDLYERPRTAFVANFLGVSNLIDGKVDGDQRVTTHDGAQLHAPACEGMSRARSRSACGRRRSR